MVLWVGAGKGGVQGGAWRGWFWALLGTRLPMVGGRLGALLEAALPMARDNLRVIPRRWQAGWWGGLWAPFQACAEVSGG